MEIDKRLRADLRNTGDFNKIHPLPKSCQDMPDNTEARLVVLGPDAPHTKDAESKALAAAKAILEYRGNTPRILRNTQRHRNQEMVSRSQTQATQATRSSRNPKPKGASMARLP